MDTSILEPNVTLECLDEDGDYCKGDSTEELLSSTIVEENMIQDMHED